MTSRTQLSGDATPLPSGNGMAVGGIVMGAMLCVPLLPLAGMIVGLFALRRSRRAEVGGRKIAGFAIILGLVMTTFQIALVGGVSQAYFTNQLAKQIVPRQNQFVMLLGNGNTRAARALCTEKMTEERVQAAADHLYDLGALTAAPNGWFGGEVKDANTVVVESALLSAKHHEAFAGTWVKRDGQWKLDDYRYYALPIDPSTQPVRK